MQLRNYQEAAISGLLHHIRAGLRRLVLVSGTGSGKTVIAASIVDRASKSGKKIIFLAHRKELIDQASQKLDEFGVDHDILMAGNTRRRPWLLIHIASVPTLIRRPHKPAADMLIIDECHRSPSESYKQIIAEYPNAVVLGLTATPCRTDGRGLGELFQQMVLCPSVSELTELGHLVPARVFAPSSPDLSKVKTQAGDYNPKQLAKAVDRPQLVGDVVSQWKKLGEDRQTVVFAVNIEHSQRIVEKFLLAGIVAEHLDGTFPKLKREGILGRFASGQTRIVSNVDVLTEGYDNPIVSCAVLARPTQSLTKYLQMAGRILRPYPGKRDALILDHAGSTVIHGFVEDDRDWSLAGESRTKKKSTGSDGPGVRMCAKCWRAFTSRLDACPGCGFTYRVTKEIRIAEGELQELKREAKLKSKEEYFGSFTNEQRFQKYAEFREKAEERNYKHGWAPMQYRQTFGEYPPNAFRQQYRDLKGAHQPEAVSA